jgi:hypothetical protein
MVAPDGAADDGRVVQLPQRVTVFLAAAVALANPATGFGAGQTTAFSDQVSRICAGALLFEGKHELGTRADAVAVSRDIRESGTRRLRRVDAVPEPDSQAATIRKWLGIERRLVAAYARDWLLIWDAIEKANTPAQRADLPARLEALVHDPDALKEQARSYELLLGVPDCTGGGY